MYFVDVNITWHVLYHERQNEKALCCCFTWIIFIELNFTVAFLVIRKTWEDRFASKMGGWRILRYTGGS